IKARIRPPNKETVIGNLLFHEGYLVSQTATDLSVFPLLDARMKAITAALARRPNDPAALAERGELLLADGKARAAVDDLHKAIANKPGKNLRPRVRQGLYEALDELLLTDFSGAEKKFLEEYRGLCRTDDPTESQRRLARFHYLVGTGREKQGR